MMTQPISWWNAVAAVAVYLATLAFYRLFLHPLARFPGPWLAAVTRYYEGYYDLVQNGQYTFKIGELHRKYGPIIRISPHELHVSDPAFFDTLYRQDAHYDKYWWSLDAFDLKGATPFTVKHHIHRARRQPIGTFFSKAKIASQQGLINQYLEQLDHRIAVNAKDGTTFDLGVATTALVRDVTNHYVLGKSYGSLHRDDFDLALLTASQGGGAMWRVSKFFRWLLPAMHAMPDSWMLAIMSGDAKIFTQMMLKTKEDVEVQITQALTPDSTEPRTIVHEIIDSKLPPADKTVARVYDEVSMIAAAGFETTASVLRLIFFHVFGNSVMLGRLRDELAASNMSSNQTLDWKRLEQLPFLTAILNEGTRLSPAIATRMQRVAPEAGFFYDQWHIPAGTPVGMTLILLHMDENLFAEPQRFDPDRWLENGVLRKMDRGFAPFGKGPRHCVGMHLAWAQLYLVVANLAQRFDFEFPDARAEDFQATSDQFAIGTTGRGILKARAKVHEA